MSLKVKLISLITLFMLMLAVLIVGVLASTQTINIKGSVSFNISDSSLYVKDIRLQNSLIGEEDIDFLPGYVNQSFTFNLGEIESSLGTIKLEIDVVNTTETLFQASTSTTIPNVAIEVEGIINGDNIEVSQAPSYTGVSGTIIVTITFTGTTQENITLDNIVINLEEIEEITYNVTFINSSSIVLYIKIDDNPRQTIESGETVYINGKQIIITPDAATPLSSLKNNILLSNEIELYSPSPGGLNLTLFLDGESIGVHYGQPSWSVPSTVENWESYETSDSAVVGHLVKDCVIEIVDGWL